MVAMYPLMVTQSPKNDYEHVRQLTLAETQEIEMEVYAGLLLVALGIAYLLVRAIQSRTTPSSVVKKRAAGSHQKQLQSNRRKMKGFAGKPSRRSRINSTEKTMAMVRRSSATNVGTIQKPWGW